MRTVNDVLRNVEDVCKEAYRTQKGGCMPCTVDDTRRKKRKKILRWAFGCRNNLCKP